MHQYQPQTHDDKSNALGPKKAPAAPRLTPVGNKAAAHHTILQMQRTQGNQFVRRAVVQRGMGDIFGGIFGNGNTGRGGNTGGGGNTTSSDSGQTSISGPGGTIDVSGGGVAISSASDVSINGAKIENNAAMINNNTAMMETSGIDKSQTVMTDTVIAQTYTPGAGNVW